MNVLHLSTYDYGGAGKAAYRLHHNLRSCGYGSRMLVLYKHTDDPDVIELQGGRFLSRALNLGMKTLLKVFTRQDYYFQHQISSLIKSVHDLYAHLGFKPDVIVAHWISNFISINDLYRLQHDTGVPVIWYLMDMAPLTGGCHYAWDCTRYMKQCGRCPALRSIWRHDLSYANWRKKHELVQDMDLTVVAGSGSLFYQAKIASIFESKRIEKIMLGVDDKIFKPVPRRAARKKLDLPLDSKIVFLGAQSMSLRRKGMSYLMDALRVFAGEPGFDCGNIVLAVAGGDFDSVPLDGRLQFRKLGFLADDRILANAYQAADFFVCPSIEDSGPMMINEAIMCGTPVVAFDMGVAQDLVHTGETGYLAELKNSEDLASGIRYILELSDNEAISMSEQCRSLALEVTSPRAQVEAFLKLLGAILS
jgi:glycosyltransferase involved in cell wall biosynthesis